MVAGSPPIRAKKARYYEDARFTERVVAPPDPPTPASAARPNDWSALAPRRPDPKLLEAAENAGEDKANAGLRREPELPDHVEIVREKPDARPDREFKIVEDDPETRLRHAHDQAVRRRMGGVARQVSMNPDDGLEL